MELIFHKHKHEHITDDDLDLFSDKLRFGSKWDNQLFAFVDYMEQYFCQIEKHTYNSFNKGYLKEIEGRLFYFLPYINLSNNEQYQAEQTWLKNLNADPRFGLFSVEVCPCGITLITKNNKFLHNNLKTLLVVKNGWYQFFLEERYDYKIICQQVNITDDYAQEFTRSLCYYFQDFLECQMSFAKIEGKECIACQFDTLDDSDLKRWQALFLKQLKAPTFISHIAQIFFGKTSIIVISDQLKNKSNLEISMDIEMFNMEYLIHLHPLKNDWILNLFEMKLECLNEIQETNFLSAIEKFFKNYLAKTFEHNFNFNLNIQKVNSLLVCIIPLENVAGNDKKPILDFWIQALENESAGLFAIQYCLCGIALISKNSNLNYTYLSNLQYSFLSCPFPKELKYNANFVIETLDIQNDPKGINFFKSFCKTYKDKDFHLFYEKFQLGPSTCLLQHNETQLKKHFSYLCQQMDIKQLYLDIECVHSLLLSKNAIMIISEHENLLCEPVIHRQCLN